MIEAPHAEPMTSVDRAWLEMDEVHNPMVVSAIFQLDGPVDPVRLQTVLVERLLRHPRFRQRIDRTQRAPRWVEESAIDYGYHVHVRRLPANAGEKELRRAISREVGSDLDTSRPLWRLFVFPQANGPVTVLFRAHHAVADGIALVTLLIDSTDAGFLRAPPVEIDALARATHPGPLGGLVARLEAVNTGLMRLQTMTRSREGKRRLVRHLYEGRDAFAAIRRVLALPADHPPMFSQPLSGRRCVGWISDLPLAPLRLHAKHLDVRVNDLLMAALAGAFRMQMLRQPGAPGMQDVRISVPVNLRHGKGRSLGNQFGLILLDLPVSAEAPAERLRISAARMAVLKDSSEARATMLGIAAAGFLPVPLEKKLVNRIGSKSVAVVSSLPGPKRHVRIADARLSRLVFWPPQSGGIGIGISFFSYAGQISFGVSSDTAMIPHPDRFLEAFRSELELLQGLNPPEKLSVVPKEAPPPARRAGPPSFLRTGAP